MKRTYGWRPDKPDFRDHRYELEPFAVLPKQVDLRKTCSPVQDQGELGSCTGNAIASAIEFLDKKNNKKLYDYSRLFIYYNERLIENTIDSDAGAEIRDGIKAINKWGCCYESAWPYLIDKFTNKPSPSAYTQAKMHLFTKYSRLSNLNQYKSCLASGYPFVFGFSVYESFESETVAKNGEVPMPSVDEYMLGGHAVLAVGYNDITKRFIVQNSWGTSWGQKGYFTMPYEYLANPDLADDFWVIKA